MSGNDEHRWVNVIFTQPPGGVYTYEVPPDLWDSVQPGQRIQVPLGSRSMAAFVTGFCSRPDLSEIRQVEDILDPYPLLGRDILDLTRWISDYYISSWGEAVRAALPPGLQRRTRLMISSHDGDDTGIELSQEEKDIIGLVRQRGTVAFSRLRRLQPQACRRSHLARLEKLGLIRTAHELETPEATPLMEKWIRLQADPAEIDLETMRRRAPRQAQVIRQLLEKKKDLPRDSFDVPLSLLRRLEKLGVIRIVEKERLRLAAASGLRQEDAIVALTEEQQTALDEITAQLDESRFHVILLHGVTSSGKTQVYIEAVRRTLEQGKTALVLIPEISLTPQAIARYRAAFGDRVAVLHSRMSPGERYDSWRKIQDGSFSIALGPRSAVFAPLEDLGLVIVDEEHDGSYKQNDPAPRYNARDTAVMRAHLTGSLVILGSATPSLESYHNTHLGKYTLCRLTRRIDRTPLPRVRLVDLRDEEGDEHGLIFSPDLLEDMERRLASRQQIILLQNRRGYAPLLRCRDCGHIETCNNCDITLTYHQRDNTLRCHYCGFQKRAVEECSSCGGRTLRYLGIGTQRVEEELKKAFPAIRVLRMDQDSTRGKHSHGRILQLFEEKKGDILLGTQMVAKGHDFPGVQLVGVISADTGLHFPDFRAGERTFQLLTQTAGRAGRRKERGEVIIQSRIPDHPVLRMAARQEYEAFYEWEMEQRRELGYPPWGRLAVIRIKGESEARVHRAAAELHRLLPRREGIAVLGPAVCPIPRIKKLYRYQIILRAARETDPSGGLIRRACRQALDTMQKGRSGAGIRVSVDIDPLDIL